jgi:hypothetical protein
MPLVGCIALSNQSQRDSHDRCRCFCSEDYKILRENIFTNLFSSWGSGYGGIFIGIALGVIYGYITFYFYECVRDSTEGSTRAPDTMMLSIPNKEEMMEQALYIFGCAAVCFLPASLYHLIVNQENMIFWILIAYGIFFFPMSFLAVVLFDSPSAFKPTVIIGSIVDTFLPYCA